MVLVYMIVEAEKFHDHIWGSMSASWNLRKPRAIG